MQWLLVLVLGLVGACGGDGPKCKFDTDCPVFRRCDEGSCVSALEEPAPTDAGDGGDATASSDAAADATETPDGAAEGGEGG